MKVIKFLQSGMMGDFIHGLQAAYHICKRDNAKADIYVTDGHWGDIWRYGSERAFNDLYPVLTHQSWVHDAYHLVGPLEGEYVNLNLWRNKVATTHSETGRYNTCWSELLAEVYGYQLPKKHEPWLTYCNPNLITQDRVVLHRSKHRHNRSFNWQPYISAESLFISQDEGEISMFPYNGTISIARPGSFSDLVSIISSAKLFVGNQSAPFAIACALDVPRICELDADPAPFYMGEEKYSDNIKWFLNDQVNNL